jgi:hypothetical protein
MNTDDDAVLYEGYVRRLGIDIAGRTGVAPDVIAALRTVEELRLERTFQSLGRHLYFDRRGGTKGREQKSKGEEHTDGQTTHGALSIKAAGVLFVLNSASIAATLSSS